MFARDPIMAVGTTLIVGRLQIDMRRKEHRGFEPLVRTVAGHSTRVVSAVTAEQTFLEGGDVLLDWPYVYVGVGTYGSNLNGVAWLQRQLGTAAIMMPVPLAVSGILHLDCCLTLIGPRQGIIHRESLVNPLPPSLDTYDFIDVDARAARARDECLGVGRQDHRRAGATSPITEEPSRTGISRHSAGLHVARAAGGGAFRCATAPLRRNMTVDSPIQ